VTRRALAFMANDRYLDWALSFLESVRSRNARLPLYCIPHGGRMVGISGLQRAFGFEMLEEGVERLDAFGRRLFPHHPRHRANLRKYAALTLAVDEVAYFDIDLVLLVDPARLFGHVQSNRADLVYLATSPGWVYAADKLALAQSMFPDMRTISAGAFITGRQSLGIDEIIATVEDNLNLYLSLRRSKVYDQPVLNFVLHRLNKRCRHIAELDPSLAGMASSRNPNLRWMDGKIVDTVAAGDVVAVHWAGSAKSRFLLLHPRMWPLQKLRRSMRDLGEKRLDDSEAFFRAGA
jgi:hypothetical protein